MTKLFDLEVRTTEFAKAVVRLCMKLPRNPINDRLIDQLVGSAGSVGANYREANDSVGDKDFVMRMKISRREAKESQHWLELILEANKGKETEISFLQKESSELVKILSTIIIKKGQSI
jgi:four helix bundle protein